jgi:hypothetical protein
MRESHLQSKEKEPTSQRMIYIQLTGHSFRVKDPHETHCQLPGGQPRCERGIW